MLDGINNEEIQNAAQRQIDVSSVVSNPINSPYKNSNNNLLIDESSISDEAINLYQKEQDVKSFNTLAMSDPNDLSHEDIIAGLFSNGVVDAGSEDMAGALASNKNLLADLGFSADL